MSNRKKTYSMDYKDEFNFHAVTLIFGKNSPKLSDFQIFKFDTMRKHPEITFTEVSFLTPENFKDIERTVLIDSHRTFKANNCMLSSGVCRTTHFLDERNNINVKDDLFTVPEYDYFSRNWDDVVKNKIRTLGMLIRSVYEGELIEVPLLINEFPKITGILLNHPAIWVKK